MEFKDYYKVLGIDKTATDDEIRKAYRKLARQHHPDVSKDKTRAEDKIKEINEAYEVLGDKEKRRQYDEIGSSWQRSGVPPGWHGRAQGRRGGSPTGDFEFGGTGFSDFFEMFFGGDRRRGRPFGQFGDFSWDEAGDETAAADTEADLMVSLDEAVRGATRKITVRRTGSHSGQTYDVRIPAGVYEGQRIRLAGQGEVARSSGLRGDLYLRVRLAPHPDFRIGDNGDLFVEADVPAWMAVLGGSIEVRTLDGQVRLTIPSGAQNGGKLRLRGKGAPVHGGKRGDLYVVVNIVVPREVSPHQRSIWEQLAKASHHHH